MEEKITSASAPKQRKIKGKVIIDIERCKGCELCTEACKENVLSLSQAINNKGYHYVLANNDLCTGCVNCALVCPDAIITVYRTKPQKKPVVLSKEEAKQIVKEAFTTE